MGIWVKNKATKIENLSTKNCAVILIAFEQLERLLLSDTAAVLANTTLVLLCAPACWCCKAK